ncbi:hypothetical protein H8N03_21030 [Ramlibacter sp. USB13]|uniref:Uncharacterized protein n=1 Tax=Ramlibacter cellulosilyticus TaxID=2764187 RepID=A0A923MUK0_9BURK|nr:hypothetical protein [Ramlibacter cellulosilyticus]MBC5785445.1 hypothetical protein [Ramlibacter cellulosilyticus]
MRDSTASRARRLVLPLAAALGMTAGASLAQAPSSATGLDASRSSAAITQRETTIDDSGLYRSEVRDCLSGWSQQDKATCLKEARHARAAERRGQLEKTGEDYAANALARCEPFAGENRIACQARVMGIGGSSGSIAGGGLLRWVETVVLPVGQQQVRIERQTLDPVVVIEDTAS